MSGSYRFTMDCKPLGPAIEPEAREVWFHCYHFLLWKAGGGNLDLSELDCENKAGCFWKSMILFYVFSWFTWTDCKSMVDIVLSSHIMNTPKFCLRASLAWASNPMIWWLLNQTCCKLTRKPLAARYSCKTHCLGSGCLELSGLFFLVWLKFGNGWPIKCQLSV